MIYNLKKISKSDKLHLSVLVMNILENWHLTNTQQIQLLDLSNSIKERHLYLYRKGEQVLNYNQHLLSRIEMIVGIYESLTTTYPAHTDYGKFWLRRPAKKFDQKSPLQLMLSGEIGMRRVWHFLDCTQSWN